MLAVKEADVILMHQKRCSK